MNPKPRAATPALDGTDAVNTLIDSRAAPSIPDHELLHLIGRGSYGEVWLARNVIGGRHAVKVIYRSAFDNQRPFQREFEGISKAMPISRSLPGLVHIL